MSRAGTADTEETAPGVALPWRGRPERADLLCWFGIMLGGCYYLLLIPLKPLLIGRNPLLLELLDGSMTSIVTAGAFARVGQVPLVLAVLAPIPATMALDPLYWWAGRRWGRGVIELLVGRGRRSARLVGRGERVFRRFGGLAVMFAYILPVPAALIYAFAGSSGMRLRTFILLDLAGTLLWSGMLAGLGYRLGHRAVSVAKTISDYGGYLALALVAGVVVVQVLRVRRGRAAFESAAPLGYRVPGE